jgi:hypothetical protein
MIKGNANLSVCGYRLPLAFSCWAGDAWLEERQMPYNSYGFLIEAGTQALNDVREGYRPVGSTMH